MEIKVKIRLAMFCIIARLELFFKADSPFRQREGAVHQVLAEMHRHRWTTTEKSQPKKIYVSSRSLISTVWTPVKKGINHYFLYHKVYISSNNRGQFLRTTAQVLLFFYNIAVLPPGSHIVPHWQDVGI